MTGLNFGAASEASRVLSGIDYVGRFASAIQTHQPLSSSPETAGLWSPPRLQFFRDALGPFFRGERTASFICDARHHNVWWRCSGPSSQSSERFCEVKGDENLHACMQVRPFVSSVRERQTPLTPPFIPPTSATRSATAPKSTKRTTGPTVTRLSASDRPGEADDRVVARLRDLTTQPRQVPKTRSSRLI